MLHNKRGSTLVTAILLMVFILLMGAVLIQWGLLNVQTTVNIRTDTQTYYTAKSVLDAAIEKLATDNDTRKAMDADLKALTKGAEMSTQKLTIPGDMVPGEVTVSIKCIETNYTDDVNCYGKQTLKMTVYAEHKEQNAAEEQSAQSASVAREFIITRTPPSSGGIIGYSGNGAGARQEHTLSGGTTNIKGDVYITNATSFATQGAITVEGNLYVDATENINIDDADISGTVVLRTDADIAMRRNKIHTVYAKSGTSNYDMYADTGAWTVTVPSGRNAATGAVLPTWKVDATAVNTAMQPLDAQMSAGYTVKEYWGEGGKVYETVPAVIEESGKVTEDLHGLSDLMVKTDGQIINLYFEKLQSTGNQTMTIDGDGEVNIYVDEDSFEIMPNFRVERTNGNAIVNFIGAAAGGTKMEVKNLNGGDQKYNILSIYGMVETDANSKQDALTGSIYGAELQLNNAEIDTTDTSFGSVLTGGPGGGTEAVISCEKGKYVR